MAISRVRAGVVVVKPVASTVLSVPGATQNVLATQVVAATAVVVPVSALSWISITYSAELDYRGLNPVVLDISFVIDSSALHLFKAQSDAVAAVDNGVLFVVDKEINDPAITSEAVGFDLLRQIADQVDATDDLYGAANIDDEQTMFLAKSMQPDYVASSDSDDLHVGKTSQDSVGTADPIGPFDVSKLRVDSALTGDVKLFDLSKSLSDAVDATDDLYGLANIDDEQTTFFAKSAAPDYVSTSDNDDLEFGKSAADAVGAQDQINSRDLHKPRADVAVSSDFPRYGFSTSRADAAFSSDSHTHFFGKGSQDSVASLDASVNDTGKTLLSSAQTADSINTKQFGKAASDIAATSESIAQDVAKQLSDLVDANDDFNLIAATDDGEIKTFAKQASDYAATADGQLLFAVNKGAVDAATSSESHAVDSQKPLADSAVAAEQSSLNSFKSATDSSIVSDAADVQAGKQLDDKARQLDGPGFWTTYTAADYFSQDYCGFTSPLVDLHKRPTESVSLIDSLSYLMVYSRSHGELVATVDLKALALSKVFAESVSKSDASVTSIGKSISDLVDATDDLLGLANVDDDQVMLLSSTKSEYAATSETTAFAFNRVSADASITSEQVAFNAIKSLIDQAAATDVAAKGVGKSFADLLSKTDSQILVFGKGVAESASTSEARTFFVSKSIADAVDATDDFYGVTNADDDQTFAYSKVSSEIVLKTDSVSVTPGKGLTDSVNRSDSGSLRMTDYADVHYFVSSYVGTSLNF